ncbi:hypothetical protein MLD38_019608 [Melastoma candidum]|uniref:Uncharacterized protein n=1 Tax=Melastoma candidum TaxID=119954 RepID=A0ACB9QYM3_9MYRT|nr:hypothetical protein MLD38_019608 [Melastoma candidum]
MKRNYRCSKALQQFYSGGPFAVSSDASFLACACGSSVNLVDASNSSIRSSIDCGSDVTAISLSPDDRVLFSADHSRQIRVWEVSTSKCLRSWKGHDGPVMSMACHASGGLLATGGVDRKVLLWDVDGGFCTHFFRGHEGVVTVIAFHPNPETSLVLSGCDDGTIRVWNLFSKKSVSVLREHNSRVTSLTFSEDGWTLLAAGRDKVVSMWDLHKYACTKTIPTYETIEALCVINCASPLASCLGLDNQLNAREDRIHFITVGELGIVRVWKSEGSTCLFKQNVSDVTVNSGTDKSGIGFVGAVILPSDGELLCVTANQQFLFYHPEKDQNGDLSLNLLKRFIGYNEEIVDMKFLGEEEQLLAVATDVQVQVYDVATMSCLYVLAGHSNVVLCLDTCVSNYGRTLIATGSKDNSIRLWNADSRCCIAVGIGHMGAVAAIAFSKKKRDFLVSGSSDRTIKVWSMDGISDDDCLEPSRLRARAVVAAHDKDINALAIAPNDSFVCSGSEDRTACIWRLPDLVSVVVLKGHKRGIWSVEFSPVDQCVLTSSGDKTIRIWAISNGSCLKTFEGHSAMVLRASFLTRGTQLVSCGGDGVVKLWSVRTSECISTYDEHEDKIWALAVGNKTEMLATGGVDANINLWYDSTASDEEEAFRKEEESVLKGQELENAVSDADFNKAIQIAFELRRPHKLFELFAKLCRRQEREDLLIRSLSALGNDEVRQLLEYIREWNSKPKFCHVAQSVLSQVFRIYSPTNIIEIKGVGELLEGLIPYSQRHFSRIDRLVRSTYLLDYTLMGMSIIEPEPSSTKSDAKNEAHVPVLEETGKNLEVVGEDEDERDQIQTQPQLQDRNAKKRKAQKSQRSSTKKSKSLGLVDAASISLQA